MKKIGEALDKPVARLTAVSSSLSDANVCKMCKGAGYLRADVEFGHPMFGKLLTCECRSVELERRDFAELERISNLEPFKAKTFDNFDPRVKGTRRAYDAARSFASDPNGWLLLSGGVGCGKTHLAAAIANQAILTRFTTLFTVVPDLLDHLRSTFGPSSEIQYDELFDKVRSTGLIVLDDLGTESATAWAREKLFQILNHRYNYRMPTVITTNQDLRRMDERIRSRLQDTSLCLEVRMDAEDYRPRATGEKYQPKTRARIAR